MSLEKRLPSQHCKDIDILCLQPGFVETKMIKKAKESGYAQGIVTTEDCVAATMRDLSHEDSTFGPASHER